MKLIRRMLLCMLLAMVFCACVGCGVYREPVALLYGIEYGMNPAEVQAVLGEPDEVEQFTGMNDVTYTWLTYEIVGVQGHPASLQLKFAPLRRGMVLTEYIMIFPGDEKVTIFTDLDAALTAQLTGFERRERPDCVDYDMNRGPVGTYYLLKIREADVWLHGECNEYDR